MADETNDKTWIADLESALSEECRSDYLYQGLPIPQGLRAEVWKSCLAAHNPPPYFDEIFDLPEQKLLRQDCQQFVAKLGNDEDEKVSVLCDLESVLTWFRKSSSSNGSEYKKWWLDLLAPLVALKLPRQETASLFKALVNRYVPRSTCVYPLLRLLVLYHDPKLCSFLDTKRVTPESYASSWFQSLFAATCSLPVVTAIWDLYFQQGDPFFLLFLALVMIINSNEQIMNMKDETKENIVEALSNLPCALQLEDVQDFCSLAQFYANRTPCSFKQEVEGILFEEDEGSGGSSASYVDIEQALVVPVSVRELVENTALAHEDDGVKFFLIDCRPADQYNAGHLPTAFHLDCNLMLQGGEVFSTAVQALLSSKRQALAANSSAGGEHLCFMGCGSLQSDQYTHMVVASFLHSNTHYVALLTGGYKALHDYFGEGIDNMLIEHNSAACQVCVENRALTGSEQKNGMQSPSKDFLGKIGAAVKMKSAEVKEKLLEYIVNPGGGGGSDSSYRHVSPNDKLGRRYRNTAPVFSIDDDHDAHDVDWEQQETDDSQFEVVSLSSWIKRPDILATFECQELKMNGEKYGSVLLVSPTHVFVLRQASGDNAKLVVRRHLSAIAKITCKKRYPKMITFKYGTLQGDSLIISDMDKFVIPKAKEATELISKHIVRLLERKEEEEEEVKSGQ